MLAVELHAGRAEQLRTTFAGDPVRVASTDLAGFRFPRRPYRVVANPPFEGAGGLARRITGRGSTLLAADLVIQRGTAYGLLDRLDPGRYTLRIGLSLPRSAFQPRPRVEAVVLQIRRR